MEKWDLREVLVFQIGSAGGRVEEDALLIDARGQRRMGRMGRLVPDDKKARVTAYNQGMQNRNTWNLEDGRKTTTTG